MKEIDLNFVGNSEDIENGENFNNIIMNNLPISYFPLNNKSLFDKLKNNNNEILSGGTDIPPNILPINNNIITIQSSNFPYGLLIKKNIKCKIKLDGISYKNYFLNSGLYTFLNLNSYNVILKNNKEFDKSTSNVSSGTSILIDLIKDNNKEYVKTIIFNSSVIDRNISTGLTIENTYDNPDYKLLVYKSVGNDNRLHIINKDIYADILLVGGGGGGGITRYNEGSGGGGGGEVCIATNYKLIKGTYIINIGEGGNGGGFNNTNGTETSILLISKLLYASGGGAGGSSSTGGNGDSEGLYYAVNGGSGGGGAGGKAVKGASSTKQTNTSNVSYYGNNGGNGYSQWYFGGGGGGGAGEKGMNSLSEDSGNGGDGILSTITGKNIYYGGGGGGTLRINGNIKGGKGGKGGGGYGADNIRNGKNGDINTGGGGGGGITIKGEDVSDDINKSELKINGKGGSGIVIIRVKKEYVENILDIDDILTNNDDTRTITEISNELNKKIIEFNNNEKPYNYLGIIPLVILIIIIWIFIFLFLLKFVHHYLANIYLYILLFIIIFLLIFESIWFLYTNNDFL